MIHTIMTVHLKALFNVIVLKKRDSQAKTTITMLTHTEWASGPIIQCTVCVIKRREGKKICATLFRSCHTAMEQHVTAIAQTLAPNVVLRCSAIISSSRRFCDIIALTFCTELHERWCFGKWAVTALIRKLSIERVSMLPVPLKYRFSIVCSKFLF